MSAESFLGFKRMLVPSKESKKQQPSSIINIFFLAVFACAYMYFPYSKAVSNKSQKRIAKQSSVMMFSATKPNLKSSNLKYKLNPFRKLEEQEKLHCLNEPLREFVSRSRISRLKAGQSSKNLKLILSKRRGRTKKNEKMKKNVIIEDRASKNNVEDRMVLNPNANHGPATLRILANPNKNVPLTEKLLINPNSLLMEEKIADTHCFTKENKKKEICSGLDKGERKMQQLQKQQYVKAVTRLQNKSLLLKTSILDSQDRISQLYDINVKLEEKVRDNDALLQEKDDLIIGIQMQLMSYEAVSWNTPNGNLVDDDSRLIELRNEHKRELNKLKNEWIEMELRMEKRISCLLTALSFWKERAKLLQSTGSEGPLERIHSKELSRATEYVDADPGTEAFSNPIPLGCTTSTTQQMQIESVRTSRTSAQDVEMEDESIEVSADPNLSKPASVLDILQKKNFELESQIYESSKTIGELNGEMRELECLNMQLSSQLDREAGRTAIKNSNTHSIQTQPGQREMWRMEVKPRKLLKFLSCRKAEIDEKLNGCEKMPHYQRVMVSQV